MKFREIDMRKSTKYFLCNVELHVAGRYQPTPGCMQVILNVRYKVTFRTWTCSIFIALDAYLLVNLVGHAALIQVKRLIVYLIT